MHMGILLASVGLVKPMHRYIKQLVFFFSVLHDIDIISTFQIADQPAFAVTGSNNYEQDLTLVLIQSGAFAFFYFLIMPVRS